MLEWNVYVSSFNDKNIKVYNVLSGGRFIEDCAKSAKKFKDDKEAFAEEVRKDLMYYYWSKCEWEIIISHWPPRDDVKDLKIDVYDQVMLNWNKFIDYLWENKKEILKIKW